MREDDLWRMTTFDERQPLMEDDNEDDLKNKEDLHIAGRHTALDIFRFAVFFFIKTSKIQLRLQVFLGFWNLSIFLCS